jgi:hypothetical protein
MPAAFLHLNDPKLELGVVVDDDHVGGRKFIAPTKRCRGLTRLIHRGARLCDQHTVCVGNPRTELPLVQGHTTPARQVVNHLKADVVAGSGIVPTRISESEDEVHAWGLRLKFVSYAVAPPRLP